MTRDKDKQTVSAADVGTADVVTAPPSRLARVQALVGRVAPAAAAQHAKDGSWPGSQAPYEFDTLADGRRRVRFTSDDGDVIAGVGPTLDDAIAAAEAKLR